MLGTVIAIMASGFLTGALARFAVPGPDPMPAWLTIAIGLVGSLVGGGIAAAATDGNGFAVSFASLGVAILLVLGYRRFVQKRPLSGRGALVFPERGIGIDAYRERLRKAGIDPAKPLIEQFGHLAGGGGGAPPPRAGEDDHEREQAELLRKLEELRDAGVLTEPEFESKRAQLAAREPEEAPKT
jgi:uncharacterized membrane protein YeaQ/YmgE (transglycosylase-associated protein family)